MRPSHRMLPVYFFILIAAVILAGCATTDKPATEEITPKTEAPPQPVATGQPEMVYEEGDQAYPEGYYVHKVSIPDENISIIAKWYTNEAKNWSVLAKCNPKLNPNRIFLGSKIKIPRSIMTRHSPLTVEFVQQSHSRPQPKKKKKIAQEKDKTPVKQTETPVKQTETPVKPVVEEDPLLFGPKAY